MAGLGKLAVAVFLLLPTLSCGAVGAMTTPTPLPAHDEFNQSNGRISIINDPATLNGRIKRTWKEVPIDPAVLASNSASGSPGLLLSPLPNSTLATNVTFTLIAEVTPPSVAGQAVQASSVVIQGGFAYVSYNTRAEPYIGAINVFDISDPANPNLVSEAIFFDSDIHSLAFGSNNVYAVQGTGDASLENPAGLEVIRSTNGGLSLDGNTRVALPSFAGTGVVVSGSRIYATSGSDGGLYVFDKNSLSLEQQAALSDARWVDIEDKRVVVVQGGVPSGRISVFDKKDLALLNTFSFTGAGIPESKSTVQVLGGKAIIAAGNGGVQILSIHTGTVVGSVPLPTDTGLDSSVVVTNSVAADGKLLFISNGEAGVYLSEAAEEFKATASEEPQDITLLGKLRFDDLQSVNHVAYEDDTLFVAAGSGGLKIVMVDYSIPPTAPPDAPLGLTATAGNGSVGLDWVDNTETNLASYNVKRSATTGGAYTRIASGLTVSAYTDNTVNNGTTYFYVVTAVDATSSESANSNEASATPVTPPTVQVLEQNTSGGDKMDVKKDQKGAQEFRHGNVGDPDYQIAKIVLHLSREKKKPNGDLSVSIGTEVNSGTISGSAVTITPSQVIDSEGQSFMTYEVVYGTLVGPLTAGTTYYINFENEAPNGKSFYLEYTSENTYANGTYFKAGSDDEKDSWFQVWGVPAS